MNKTLVKIAIGGALMAATLAPIAALAQDYTLPAPITGTGRTALTTIVDRIANFVFFALVIISTIFILWGAYLYLMGQNDDGKAKVINAAIAITVGLLAKILPALVYQVIGGGLGGQ